MPDITVRVGQQSAIKVASTSTGSGGTLGGLTDTDTSAVSNGSVIVYDANTSTWVATNTLTPGNTKDLDVNGGSF
jgi:hypothetical protein